MKNIGKYILIAAALFSVILIILAVALRRAFPPEKIKSIALKEISERLGREVTLGKVSIGLFTGVALSDFRLSEKPDFKAGTFIEAKKFSLNLSLLPLLEKKIEIDSVRLDAPRVQIRRLADGKTFNFSDLLPSATAPAALAEKKADEGMPVKVLVTKAKISGGEFDFKDESPERIQASVRSFNLTVQGSSVKKPVKINLSSHIQTVLKGQGLNGDVSFSGVVSAMEEKIKVDRLSWETEGLLKMSAKGTFENFLHPKVDGSLEMSEISLSKLKKLLPPAQMPSFMEALQFEGQPKIRLEVKGDFNLPKFRQTGKREGDMAITLAADFKESALQFEPYIRKSAGEIFSLDFSGSWKCRDSSKETAEFSHLALNIKEGSLEGEGKVSSLGSDSPEFSVDMKIKKFPLDELRGAVQNRLPRDLQIGGRLSGEARLSGSAKSLSMQVNLDAGQARVQVGKNLMKEESVPLSFELQGNVKEKKSIEVSKFILKFKNGSIESSGNISDFTSADLLLAMNLKTKDFLVEDLTGMVGGAIPKGLSVTGKLSLDSSMAGRLSNANIKLNMDAGQVKFEAGENFKKDASVPLIIAFSGTVKNQKAIEVSGLKMVYQKTEINARGNILNFSPPSGELTVESQAFYWGNLPPGLVPEDISLGGSAKIVLECAGTLEKNQVKMNMDMKDSEIIYGAGPATVFKKNASAPMRLALLGTRESSDNLKVGVKLILGTIDSSADISFSRLNGPRKNFSLKLLSGKVPLKELSVFLPGLNSYRPEGMVQADCSLSGTLPFDSIPKGSGWIALENAGMDVQGTSVRNVNGRLTFNETGYELSDLSGKVSDTPFQLKLSLKNLSSPAINLEASLEKLDLSQWTSSAKPSRGTSKESGMTAKEVSPKSAAPAFSFPPSKTAGKVRIKELLHPNFEGGNFSLEWNLSDITPKLDKVSGTAKLRSFGGEVKKLGSVEKILKIINPSLSIMNFTDIGGDFLFKDGVMQIKDFWVESDKLTVGAEGPISLPDKSCNINILARYSGAALAASVPVSVSGPLSSPKIEKKNISILSQTLQEKVFRLQPKSAEEIAEKKQVKEEKIAEKKEEIKLKEETKKEQSEERRKEIESDKQDKEDLKKQKEDERLEKLKEKEELKKQKEEERLEKLREKEEEKQRKKEEKEEE